MVTGVIVNASHIPASQRFAGLILEDVCMRNVTQGIPTARKVSVFFWILYNYPYYLLVVQRQHVPGSVFIMSYM